MNSSNYFFDDGTSRKFWSYALRGKKQTIRHGRIGTKGRETTKTFPSASAARASTEKSVNQKIGKGYLQVNYYYYYSISLVKNPGCVYYWNEDAGGYDVGEHGPIFDNSHAILVAGSFNEFVTRIALYENPNENEEPANATTRTDDQDAPNVSTNLRPKETPGITSSKVDM